MSEKNDFSLDIRHRGKSRDEMIKDVQRLLLQNDFDVKSVLDTTKYLKENLKTNIEYVLSGKIVGVDEKNKKFIPKSPSCLPPKKEEKEVKE